ncbi:Beta-1,2-xylosyltransferase 1 [Venustampulla echinocandica]|uniref:Beta-1,2-xylosyltransferase 1 n=1 Tax=Venustampulla echinocandica TaxID=2656787 RepID=A0A370TMF1_9HELO|nr:Beta-1,2-xylosyltransferase 1 [Venustampulla echinocandica]RDL36698.1 Beta-1,2-xylosyltransferase 1 [Venustampulla echinocandica]
MSTRDPFMQSLELQALSHVIASTKVDLESLLKRQSKNYTAAYEEYRRRYNAEPPPGFEAWYEFAAAHQSRIIDDFDTIFDSISPFWRFSGKGVITTCRTPNRQAARRFGRNPSRPHFLVNHLDEPRVLAAPQSFKGGDSYGKGQFKVTDISRRPSWDAITKFCTSQQRDRSARPKHEAETFGLPFVTDPFLALDLCRHPKYSGMHALVMGPTSFYLIESLVPMLSTGSPSTMGDLLFPSLAYMQSEFQYDEAHDVEWDRKQNNIYWAGSSTGGFAIDDQWRHYQRQRSVKLAQNLERQQHYYLRERGGVVHRVKSSFLNSRLFDAAFTRILHCERKYCRDQSAYFNVKSWADKDRALRSRLVYDTDGNGISGRYYKLLASKPVPLKQTLFQEWHDERLVPWVHYVRVSQGMEEVPELVFYLTSTEAGQQRAKEIAEQGRDWFSRAFRDIDLSIYTYRLLLELARLQDPERQAS